MLTSDAEIEALEAENVQLRRELDTLTRGDRASISAQDLVVMRGLSASIAAMEQEIKAIEEEVDVVTHLRTDVEAAAQAEREGMADIAQKSVENSIGALNRQLKQLTSENKGLTAVNKRQKRVVTRLEAKERSYRKEVDAVREELNRGREKAHAMSHSSHDETRRFQAKLRAEQELALALNREVRAAKARATDVTPLFVKQRAVALRRVEWEGEKETLLEQIHRLETHLQRQRDNLDAEHDRARYQLNQHEAKLASVDLSLKAADEKIEGYQQQGHQVREQLRDLGLYVSETAVPSEDEVEEASKAGQACAVIAASVHAVATPTAAAPPPSTTKSVAGGKEDASRLAQAVGQPSTPTAEKPRFKGRDGRFAAAAAS